MTAILIRIAAISVVIGFLTFLQGKINVGRQNRGRQFIMPVLAFVYCAAVLFVVVRIFDLVAAFDISFIPFINSSLVLLVNFVLMVGFIVIKIIVCPIVSTIWKSQSLMERTSSRFYEFEDSYSNWFLRQNWVNFRQLAKLFVVCTALGCMGYIYFTMDNIASTDWVIYFPGAVLIVITEVWNFVNGITKEEFRHRIVGDDADSRRIGQYYRVREIYEEIFEPQVLTAHTGCEFTRRFGSTETIKELMESGAHTDKIIASYFELADTDIFPDPDYIRATKELMYRENVLFFNPFYRDMGLYITLPIVNALLCGKKCLVIAGRSSACGDIKQWLSKMIKGYSRMESLWRVADLSTDVVECEIGMLSLMQLYDLDVLKHNREFFSETDFVLLIEPSVLLNTGQIGLSMITDEMRKRDVKPVYCICDRKTEGLVDTLSHLLYTEITNVLAMPLPRCMYAGMTWNANGDYIRQQLFDKQTRFLGNGIELAAVAVKNQIPKVTWYSETKAPVRDIKWIAGQYHPTICRYMNLPSQQNSIYKKISFESNLWGATVNSESFLIAEDEFCNMFSIMRAYLSRGSNQMFVNILSENYLLRDYMRHNRQMFTSDPNAIPSIVPDYAKTERNAIIKLLLYMGFKPVSEHEIINELNYAGIAATDPVGTLTSLLRKYTFVDESIFIMHRFASDETFDTRQVDSFSISVGAFDRHFADSLKNAYYVVEDEEREAEYLDGKLFGHVTQQLLPGQYVTYDGKYYIAKFVSPAIGVVLRRASDLYDGRKYYRQVRAYKLEPNDALEVVSLRKVNDVEIAFVRYDISVVTSGYLEMQDNNDLRTARLIDFTGDPSAGNFTRRYKNKTVLRLHLPDTSEETRHTVCLLLSEIFRSTFHNSWHYIAVTTRQPGSTEGMLNYLMYRLDTPEDDEHIYIIEDSDMDLGLLEAVERNLNQFMEIVTDFLDWHFEKLREPAHDEPALGEGRKPADVLKRSMFGNMADRIRKLFGGKKDDAQLDMPPAVPEDLGKGDLAKPETEDAKPAGYPFDDADEEADKPISAPVSHVTEGKLPEESNYLPDDKDKDEVTGQEGDYVHIDGTDIFDDEDTFADTEWLEAGFKAAGIAPIEKTRYQQSHYLKFGFDDIDKRLQLVEVRNYLRVRGFSNNLLTQARTRDILEKKPLDFDGAIICDFCGQPLSGISYEKIIDGRTRCNICSSSAITSVNEFKDIFFNVLGMMEGLYGINFKVPISVKMTDARTIARGAGSVYKPTQASVRVLGYAQKKGGNYNIFVENGSPYLASVDLIVHELTHIWQFLNWKEADIKKIYGKGGSLAVYEGMAMWAAIQYLYQIGETYYAELQESIAVMRNDAYGEGLLLFRERYPFVKDSSLLKFSPFSTYPPL
ncbi:MAG: hypothetical protein FWC77_04440 [Defluviitaleaceae bacterium]|nr:hypothetical protein [Defluviitaleaceae bacterium]